MRILIVTTRFFYGDGEFTYASSLADLLRVHGHTVNYFAMQDDRNLPDSNSDLFVTNINFRELNAHKNLKNGVKVAGRIFYSTEAREKFSRMIERVKPDIVHLQNIHSHITPSVIFESRRRGIPVVWTLHDYRLVCPNTHFLIDRTSEICEACRGGRYWNAPLKRCKKNSFLASTMTMLEAYSYRIMRVKKLVDAFITPSMFLQSKLIESGFPQKKIHHNPLFLPENMFDSTSRDEGYLLFIGRLEPHKGIGPLVEAARRVPGIRIIIAGRMGVPMETMVSGPLPPNVEYVGFKSGTELNELRRNARAFLVPSLWFENQPFSILEAFALGKPVIASDLGGMRELVGDDNARGLSVPAGNVDALAQAMQWMIDHPEGARRMGELAFQYAMEDHSAGAHYQRLLKVYEGLLPR